MYIIYVDETGDAGLDIERGASPYYCLGIAMVHIDDWEHAHNSLLTLRRQLKADYGIPIRAEIKASNLLRNGGWFSNKGIQPWHRREIFKRHLAILEAAKVKTFAVYLDKSDFNKFDNPETLRIRAWTYALQRVSKTFEGIPVMIVHDEGDNKLIRSVARKSTRILSTGSSISNSRIILPTVKVIDDPVPRDSKSSYFLQIADMVAYAAAKAIVAPNRKIAKICPQSTWTKLGSSCLTIVNQYRRERSPDTPPGIITQRGKPPLEAGAG